MRCARSELGQLVEQLVRGAVEFRSIGVVSSILNLLANRRDFVGADIVGFQGRQQGASAGQFQPIDGANGRRIGSDLLTRAGSNRAGWPRRNTVVP